MAMKTRRIGRDYIFGFARSASKPNFFKLKKPSLQIKYVSSPTSPGHHVHLYVSSQTKLGYKNYNKNVFGVYSTQSYTST
jgi:hypothetical protein